MFHAPAFFYVNFRRESVWNTHFVLSNGENLSCKGIYLCMNVEVFNINISKTKCKVGVYLRPKQLIMTRWRIVIMSGICLFLLFIIMEIQEEVCYRLILLNHLEKASYQEDKIRIMAFQDNSLEQLKKHCEESGLDFIKELTYKAILFDYELKGSEEQITYVLPESMKEKIESLPFYGDVYHVYQSVLQDAQYFPIPNDLTGGESVGFDNSFGAPRTYGGDRSHEGTDLIPSIKERGYFPVVSISNGVIEKIGWLELGGWRLYIRNNSGGYYYYAHLDSYAFGLKEGDTVTAGQLLGFMGDTGYGKEEGTKGQFIVHLHFGIYVDVQDRQVSINPYPVLRLLQKNCLSYRY